MPCKALGATSTSWHLHSEICICQHKVSVKRAWTYSKSIDPAQGGNYMNLHVMKKNMQQLMCKMGTSSSWISFLSFLPLFHGTFGCELIVLRGKPWRMRTFLNMPEEF